MYFGPKTQNSNGNPPEQVKLHGGPMDGGSVAPPDRYPGNWGRWLINVRFEAGRCLYESHAGDRGRAQFVPGSIVKMASSLCPEWQDVGWWEQRDDGEGF